MSYVVTLNTGVADLVLPNGVRAQAGQKVVLTDDEFARLSPTVLSTLLNTTAPVSSTPGTYVAPTYGVQTVPYLNGWSAANDPLGAGTDVASTQTTPYSETNNTESLEEG